jgi:branched-chain amino acid transport system permease protein
MSSAEIIAPRAPASATSWRWLWAAPLLAALAAVPSLFPNVFYLHIANLIFLNVIFAASLGLILKTGQLSLCHAAFAGLGAYASALLAIKLKLSPILGVLTGAAGAGIMALLLGLVILRLRGVYFVLVTFLFGQLFNLVVLDAGDITRGANGIVGIPPIRAFEVNFGSPFNFYYLGLAVAALVVLFIWALLRSPTGRAFVSTQENLALAEASGIDTSGAQLLAFTIGSAIAGLGGGLMGQYVHFISPDTFTFWESVDGIVMVVIGGRSSLVGWIIGAVFLTPLPELLREAKSFQHVLYGSILVLVLMFLPNGLASIGARLRRLSAGGEPRERP